MLKSQGLRVLISLAIERFIVRQLKCAQANQHDPMDIGSVMGPRAQPQAPHLPRKKVLA
jgi:hypothetical protein